MKIYTLIGISCRCYFDIKPNSLKCTLGNQNTLKFLLFTFHIIWLQEEAKHASLLYEIRRRQDIVFSHAVSICDRDRMIPLVLTIKKFVQHWASVLCLEIALVAKQRKGAFRWLFCHSHVLETWKLIRARSGLELWLGHCDVFLGQNTFLSQCNLHSVVGELFPNLTKCECGGWGVGNLWFTPISSGMIRNTLRSYHVVKSR